MDPRLLQAAKNGNLPLFRRLADHDQYPSPLLATTPQSNTLLHLAARHGHVPLMAELLRRQPTLLPQLNFKGDTALHVAARLGHAQAVDLLLERAGGSAAEVAGMRNKADYTALHEAVRSGKVDAVARLAEAAVLDVEPGSGVSSLIYLAAEVGVAGVVSLLLGSLEMAQSSSLCGPGGRTALHAAVVHNHFDVARLLVERYPKLVKQGDSNKITPLHCAATVGSLKMAKLLLHTDTSTAYELDNSGRSPIHMAAFNGHVSVVREIYRCCPDSSELLDSRSCNILHLAVERGRANVVDFILEYPELDDLLNEKDVDGNSPLHLAAANRNLPIVYLLCTHKGADTGIQNNNSLTALDIAELDGDPNMKVRQFRILRALRLVGARRGSREGNVADNILRTGTDEALLRSYKARANTLSLVATLIATVTFAAAFTLPGGYKNNGPDEGSATLLRSASLKAFLIADTVSLCSSIIAAFLLIWAATGDQDLLVHTLRFSMELMWLALQSKAVAFVTGVYAVASDSKWLIIVVSMLGCSIPSTVSLVLLCNLIPLPLRWRRSNRAALMKLFVLDFTSMIAFDDLDGKSSFWSTLTRALFWRRP